MIAGGRFALVRTTLLDYPGKVAAAVFLPGCALRCPFCHNPEFVDPARFPKTDQTEPVEDAPFNTTYESFHEYLKRRSPVLGGVVFSGGEALLHPLLPRLIKLVRLFGIPVKLDTAGLWPEKLAEYLESGLLDYVAVDLKTRPDRYGELGWNESQGDATAALEGTIELLSASGVDFEVRTTVVPDLVDEPALRALHPLAARAPRWIWQRYIPGHTLNPSWGALRGLDEDELKALAGKLGWDEEVTVR